MVNHAGAFRSEMNTVEKLVDGSQNLIDATLLNQIGWRPVLKQTLTRKQP